MPSWIWSVSPEHYPVFLKTGTFALRRVGRPRLAQIRPGDRIFAYLSGLKVVAGMFEALGRPFEDTTPLAPGAAFPHRLRVRPLVALSEEAWVSFEAFHDKLDVVRDYAGDFRAVVQQVVHPLPTVDAKVLEFLVRAREATDLEKMFEAYEAYRVARQAQEAAPAVGEAAAPYAAGPFDRAAAVEALIDYIEATGFVYAPWEVAAYVTALRTKPFVILAGVTGTGKSRLPALVEEGTGGTARLVPVRPDWTDSADVLGYVDLQGRFRPGAVLHAAREAMQHPTRHLTCIVDEMNLARVEHYFAEVLSRIEDRHPAPHGGFESPPLLAPGLQEAAGVSAGVRLSPNFALVGTVNMDESAHGFSRKVLDRAFTLELSDVDLTAWTPGTAQVPEPACWPVSAWYPRALRLAGLDEPDPATRKRLTTVMQVLAGANEHLAPAQLQVAYRTRDEVALFVLHAAEVAGAFRTREGTPVDPLDLALHMKVLPRLLGGSHPLRRALFGLLGWAVTGDAFTEDDARAVLDDWEAAGSPNALPGARFPRTAARLCLMTARLLEEGYTSFWV
ncbi:AAA family ATPase [Rhodocaloribacter litoris]|uniref:AAA family ATPase n=1 Tax=Rhodocaloribacter litoris TaxID=2558931 RepID=UPI00142185E9|nr:AAA family ATPase [Rhodocaloribacter litoris]QXD16979.1 AAA family ATPase [Rhodocaloribacter litoris]